MYYTSIYLIELFFFISSINLTHMFFNNYVQEYKDIVPTHKKWYVSSNIVKGSVFAMLSYHSIYLLHNYLMYNNWENKQFLYLGCLYASLDMSAIIVVPKMQQNTKYHHIIVNILFFYGLINNMCVDSFFFFIVIYAIWSSLAFTVNLYLGYRIIIHNSLLVAKISEIALINYLVCCIFNWTYQFNAILINDEFYNLYGICPLILYSVFILIIMYDDLILINHLFLARLLV